jgi:hypothetical protein
MRPLRTLEVVGVTYTHGTVEEIEADERDYGASRHMTFVNYRVLFMTTIYTEIVRRLDRRAVIRLDIPNRPYSQTMPSLS